MALQKTLLNELQTEQFWQSINVNRLDDVRVTLWDLMKYLDKDQQPVVETYFEDTFDQDGISIHEPIWH